VESRLTGTSMRLLPNVKHASACAQACIVPSFAPHGFAQHDNGAAYMFVKKVQHGIAGFAS
jgi:hypothetical protein